MNADQVKRALVGRWPDNQYLHIPEAPLDAMRMGCKADVLIVGLWGSKGYELDAVEVKVSYADWRKEIEQVDYEAVGPAGQRTPLVRAKLPEYIRDEIARRWECDPSEVRIERRAQTCTAKSQLWRDHAHRFWIACPTELAAKILADLPVGWGLIAVDAKGTKVVKPPTRNVSPRPLSWPHIIGLMRTCADAGMSVRQRAHDNGYAEGVKSGRAAALHELELYAEGKCKHGWLPELCWDSGCAHYCGDVGSFSTTSALDLTARRREQRSNEKRAPAEAGTLPL